MPTHRKTSSWQSTVAGTMSVNCPSTFKSGTTELGETGWWTLQTFAPPQLDSVLRTISGSVIHMPDASIANSLSVPQFLVHDLCNVMLVSVLDQSPTG